jgi:hypothetical protein
VANILSSPVKPQAGQRTDEKNLPQLGQVLAPLATSVSQLSQKKRGVFLNAVPVFYADFAADLVFFLVSAPVSLP